MKKVAPYLFTVGLFFIMACGDMLTRGMFMDGLIYSGVAKSMSQGIGSFWHPSYTLTSFPSFYEHPPLMMWLMSLWFRLFGASILTAKFYSIAITIVCAVLVVCVWKRMGGKPGLSWLPLLMCTLIPPISHFANNNVLEFTMAVFVLASVWCMLGEKHVWLGHFAAGILLACAFLTKGLTGLFPLVLPVLVWITGSKIERGFWRTVVLTFSVLAGAILSLGALLLLNNDAAEFLRIYLNHQVLDGMHVQTVDSRFYVVGRFFIHTAIIVGVAVLLLLLGQFGKESSLKFANTFGRNRMAWTMMLLALCGVLPMIVSTKQRDFYLLTAFPFWALAMASLMSPYVETRCRWVSSKAATVIAVVVLVASIAANAYMCGKPGRDKALIGDMDCIAPCLDEGEVVTVPKALVYQYNLQGYYYMERGVSLGDRERCRHLLTTDEYPADSTYREVPLPTEQYHLYELQAE